MNFADRVKDSTTTSGTGTVTLANSAPLGYRTFASAFSTGLVVGYAIVDQTTGAWETGSGTLLTATTLSRDTVLSSSNAGALVNFGSASKDVFCDVSAQTLPTVGGGSARIVALSSTCVSDADVSTGSTTFGTDQRAKIQAILDLGTTTPIVVVVDGCYSAGAADALAALRVHSGTKIVLLPGCGIILRSNANVSLLSNYNRTVSTPTDGDFYIEGPGTLNGNGTNQAHDTTAGGWVYVADFIGFRSLKVTGGAQIVGGRTFNLHLANWTGHVVVDNVDVAEGSTAPINTDGIHFNGPGNRVTLRNIRLSNVADDGIAINADDGIYTGGTYDGNSLNGPYGSTYGPINEVTIDNVSLADAEFGIRILSGASRIEKVTVSNVKGTTSNYWLVIDNFDPTKIQGTGPGNVGRVILQNIQVDCSTGPGIMAMAVIDCKVDQIILSNYQRNSFLNGTAMPSLLLNSKANVGQLLIDKYVASSLSSYGSGTVRQIALAAGAQVNSMMLVNSSFVSDAAISGYPVAIDSGATVKQLLLTGNTGQNFTNFLAVAGTVTSNHQVNNFMDGGALSAGAASLNSIGNGTASLSAGNAAGGAPPYTLQWYRSTTNGSVGSAVSGATSATLNDTGLTNGTTYYYTCAFTDSAAATVNSNQVGATPSASGASTWALEPSWTEVSASSVYYTYNSGIPVQFRFARKTTSDSYSGNVKLSAIVNFASPTIPSVLAAGLVLRGTNIQNWTNATCYCTFIDIGTYSDSGTHIGVSILLINNGAISTIGFTNTSALVAGQNYQTTFNANGSTLSVTLIRSSDGYYLNSSGVFVSGAATCLTITDTTIAAAASGYGVMGYAAIGPTGAAPTIDTHITVSSFAQAAAT